MPGPWFAPRDDPEAWRAAHVDKGSLLEVRVCDQDGLPQGTALLEVGEKFPMTRTGQWLAGSVVAVSDEYLQWWLDDGPGAVSNRYFGFHLCAKQCSACKASKEDAALEFHVELVRELAVGDLTHCRPTWMESGAAARDLQWLLDKLSAEKTGPQAKEGEPSPDVAPPPGEMPPAWGQASLGGEPPKGLAAELKQLADDLRDGPSKAGKKGKRRKKAAEDERSGRGRVVGGEKPTPAEKALEKKRQRWLGKGEAASVSSASSPSEEPRVILPAGKDENKKKKKKKKSKKRRTLDLIVEGADRQAADLVAQRIKEGANLLESAESLAAAKQVTLEAKVRDATLKYGVPRQRKLPCVGPEAKPLLSALLHGLNFHYCCGWTKTICWPPPEKVTNRQLVAVAALRKSVGLPSEEESVGGLKEAEDILTSKTFDYDGLEVQRVSTLSAPLIIEAWPAVGEAAVANIEEFLEGDALDAVRCPQRFFKKGNDQPPRSKKAKVLASQEDWNTVVSAAFGHLIVNGAGAVKKLKMKDGVECEVQRFISNFIPINVKEIPQQGGAMLYLDSFDEIRVIDKACSEILEGTASEHHSAFKAACAESGLPLNAGKALVGAVHGGIQGGYLDGQKGTIGAGADRSRKLVLASLGLLMKAAWSEQDLRRWVGLATFVAVFRRPLFSIFQEVFPLIELARHGPVEPSPQVIDEVISFVLLLPLAFTSLRAHVHPEMSCTDASLSGGGAAVAKEAKLPPLAPEVIVDDETCSHCGGDWLWANGYQGYPCPASCGRSFCSIWCVEGHRKLSCRRKNLLVPTFAEFFAGPEYPLTNAVAMNKVAVKLPFDREVNSNDDFWTPSGKERLESMDLDPLVVAKHWGPERPLFVRERGRQVQLVDGRWVNGPPAVRDMKHLDGFPWLPNKVAFEVRRANQVARRSLRSLANAPAEHTLCSVEHPWYSYLWYFPEAVALANRPEIFTTRFSACCFGGQNVHWICLLHNSPRLHHALHKPECHGHRGLREYDAWVDAQGHVQVASIQAAGSSAQFCAAFAEALVAELADRAPLVPGKLDDKSLRWQLMVQLRGACNSLRSPAAAEQAVSAILPLAEELLLSPSDHLKRLLSRGHYRGTEVRLQAPDDDSTLRTVPYPAHLWRWRTTLSFAWSHEDHINTLEMAAALAEIRRRARQTESQGCRFFLVLDSQVVYHVLAKGRSSSKRLNRLARRVMAVQLMCGMQPLVLWTISGWNFADAPSRAHGA
ncbi:unnamed protein product [Effrenium voratum]|uniref:Uncharacterized protein n=1 Tax=Effrenium voratum TaxID=2562239 RepID=A0AA36IXK5_9DINO|nr:unnamed protein product [Effrenium voratum]